MKSQRGGFLVGLIIGLLSGLALALAVALYITKVPVPFVNKVPQRTGERDAHEVEKNRNWNPNSPLQSKAPLKPPATAGIDAAPGPKPEATDPASEPAPVARSPVRTPAERRSGQPAEEAGEARAPSVPARDPAAILEDRRAVEVRPRDDPFNYFVQAGAYSRTDEAEQQRARLAMLGLEARVTEREQAGRTVYRVRVGPFSQKDQADRAKERLDSAAIETTLVRVQK